MNRFVNRERELESLRQEYLRPGASLYVLYGRRRLGKTRVLAEFLDRVPGIYHMADRSAERDAVRLLAQSMARGLGEPALAVADYPDWYALLATFDRFRPEGKTLLVLDEYQYLCASSPAFSSVLQRWWDEHWARQPIMLVLCGSILSMMYRETLARSSPLYGRRTAQWLLTPMRFREVAGFLPALDERGRLEMWSLTGGVPRYAELAAPYLSFRDAFRSLVLQKDGPLYAEASLLLQEEVTTPNLYWSVLHAIAAGACRISEIAGRIGLPANQLTRYLAALHEMGLVRREVSVTEPNPARSKRGVYQITDLFVRLWFGCVAPFESLLELGRVEDAEALMADRLSRHCAWAFEDVCRQYVEDRAAEWGAIAVGRWWDAKGDVDVAAVDAGGRVVAAGECRWSRRPLGARAAEELARKLGRTWPGCEASMRLMLFSASGFTGAARRWAETRGVSLIGPGELAGPIGAAAGDA